MYVEQKASNLYNANFGLAEMGEQNLMKIQTFSTLLFC